MINNKSREIRLIGHNTVKSHSLHLYLAILSIILFKGRNQIESLRVEIANLKRTIQDKDLLLEKSKEMLKIAAEREEDLLKEVILLDLCEARCFDN